MYNPERVKRLQKELEPYASSPQAAMQIATSLERGNVKSLNESAVYSDAALLRIRGIGTLNLKTIRTAWQCLHDPVLHRTFMLTKKRSQRQAILNEINDLSSQLEMLDKEIIDLEGGDQ